MTQQLQTETQERINNRAVERESNPYSAQSFGGGLLPIAKLQRTLGNRRVAQLIQTKRLLPDGRIVGSQTDVLSRRAEFADDPGSSPFSGEQPEAENIFADSNYVRPLRDGNFDSIFHRRNTVVVVQFWRANCRGPCGRMAQHISELAERYQAGPYANVVRFYQVQLGEDRNGDRIPNPRLSRRFTFGAEGTLTPVTYFYYTATQHAPTNEAPLLEASIAGAVPMSDVAWRIEYILDRHGHRQESRPVQVMRSADPAWCDDEASGSYDRRLPASSSEDAFRSRINVRFLSPASAATLAAQLNTRYGQVTCLAPFPHERYELRIANCDEGCTRPTIQIHEEAHVSDVAACCRAWRNVTQHIFSQRVVNQREALRVYTLWLDWLNSNRQGLEARADRAQLAALQRLFQQQSCAQVTAGNRECCARINDWIRQLSRRDYGLQSATGQGLTQCPWPIVSVSAHPPIEQASVCQGSGQLDQQSRVNDDLDHDHESAHSRGQEIHHADKRR